MIETGKLRHFLAVFDHRHFGRAAEALGVSQQAVSAALGRLEEQLSVVLFERATSGVVPTSFALTLEPHARLSVAQVEFAEAEIAAQRLGGHRTIRLGVGQSFTNRIAPQAVGQFRSRQLNHSMVCIVGATASLYQALLRGDLDLVVSAPPNEFISPAEIQRELLLQERDAVLVRADHPLANEPECGLAALADFPWLAAVSTIGGGWQRICQTFVSQGVTPPQHVVRTDSVALAESLILADDFIAVMSFEANVPKINAGRLIELSASLLIHPRPGYLAWDGRREVSSAMRALMQLLRTNATI